MRGEGKMHQALEAKMAPAEACTNGKMPWAFDGWQNDQKKSGLVRNQLQSKNIKDESLLRRISVPLLGS